MLDIPTSGSPGSGAGGTGSGEPARASFPKATKIHPLNVIFPWDLHSKSGFASPWVPLSPMLTPISAPPRCHPFPDTFAEPLQNLCRYGPEPHVGELCRPPLFPSSPCRAPKAAFTKYGRVFFCLPVFGTPAAAQERSFPDAEVSPTLLHPPHPSPLSPSPTPTGRGVMCPPPNSLAPLDPTSAAGASHSSPKITVIGVLGWGEREAREKGAQWWHPLASLPTCGYEVRCVAGGTGCGSR